MNVLAFGEILFDCYPTGDKIGGAPFNFAAHLAQLGESTCLYGAVGRDDLGEKAIRLAQDYGVNTEFLQKNPDYPTGICKVTYQNQEPNYDLSQESASDHILYQKIPADKSFDVLYFGTLACRMETSKNTLQQLKKSHPFSTLFFDMNLRQNYYTQELVKEGLQSADMVKMNREEYFFIKEIASVTEEITELSLKEICRKYNIKTAILTLDKDGACVWDETQGFYQAEAAETNFVSAVGAGDSFCACFLYHYMKGRPLSVCLKKASLLSAFVVSKEEAIPVYPEKLLKILTEE